MVGIITMVVCFIAVGVPLILIGLDFFQGNDLVLLVPVWMIAILWGLAVWLGHQ